MHLFELTRKFGFRSFSESPSTQRRNQLPCPEPVFELKELAAAIIYEEVTDYSRTPLRSYVT